MTQIEEASKMLKFLSITLIILSTIYLITRIQSFYELLAYKDSIMDRF
jgi:hypothetical protein